ncbi:coiled-coil domain-containing protein 55-domain containing protein, partial [Phlyctochytrium arcticum]
DQPVTSLSSSSSSTKLSSAQKRVNRELRLVQSTKSRLADEEHKKALEEDPNVFDYDAVYDDLKKGELEKRQSRDNPDGGPRYMANLIKASAQRKLDLERAELRKVQREREEEGLEFGDKDKFVTGAYKQHIADLQKAEEEEKRREALERVAGKGGDMTVFYRDLLDKTVRDPTKPIVKSSSSDGGQDAVGKAQQVEAAIDAAASEQASQQKAAARASRRVQVNDSDEVVDKRQLLSGGLNLTNRTLKRQAAERTERDEEAVRQLAAQRALEEAKAKEAHDRRILRDQQMRARELVLGQQKEVEEAERKRTERDQEELLRKMARKTTEETVSDAKARYLARKQ